MMDKSATKSPSHERSAGGYAALSEENRKSGDGNSRYGDSCSVTMHSSGLRVFVARGLFAS